ncbi:NAC domain-containing protein 35 [Cornus florida]|uniref:NAC domain-containing protein 35 n=1 Tax=Cornus florida TaxID=4283 RepID=UPI0028A1E75A|nr:NAC domain-containing protein 35 [Cornus florida]
MAIAATMSTSQDDHDQSSNNKVDDDQHEHDVVMPGFRFHPTEEELVEFYLRRKVEGKRFNVELITFLDLYRYDPWELPALAAIGEKEWFFYVPRDRKYRNGDRPNRVTTSGYWKATGADRLIRTEDSRSIGLKKTLVFYSGKAPKGIRTSWIMNEYRLPQHETERLQKAEISLCRVYKRAGVEDHPSLPRSLSTRASSSRGMQPDKKQLDAITHPPPEQLQTFGGQTQQVETEKMSETSGSSSNEIGTALGLSKHTTSYTALTPMTTAFAPLMPMEEDRMLLHHPKQVPSLLIPNCTTILSGTSFVSPNSVDDLHRLVNYQQVSINHQQQYYQNQLQHLSSQFSSTLQPQSQSMLALNPLPGSFQAVGFSDRLWDWNSVTDATNKDYTSPFK